MIAWRIVQHQPRVCMPAYRQPWRCTRAPDFIAARACSA